jgi:hypothetical protein
MDNSKAPRYRFSLGEFTIAFVPFALLLGAALLAGEASLDPGFARTVYTIWATTALVTPALCAFALPGDSPRKHNVWFLFWLFSFVAYLVHMGYAIFAAYHGSFDEFIAGQGVFPAIINVVFTLLWALDVGLMLFYRGTARWVGIERLVAHVFVGLTFFASTVILKHGFVNVIGIVMTGSILVCLALRYDARRPAVPPPVRAPENLSIQEQLRTPVRRGGMQ